MLFTTPKSARIRKLDDELDGLQARLRQGMGQARPWTLPLRRQQQARSWASSIRIEGFDLLPSRAEKLARGETEAQPGDEDEAAFLCYAHAMEHVTVLAVDPQFKWLERVIYDLHFEACRFQRDKHPGLLRTDSISVTSPGGGIAYRGPDHSTLPKLMKELVKSLMQGSGSSVAVDAAMAHLNLISIHPFEDGNGRISRILQSLVLAREGVLAPELGSIEQYLAKHTDDYYAVLMEVQGGSFDPGRDATPWVEFCLEAHVAQAKARIRVIDEAATRWDRLERLVADRGWDERLTIALEQALYGSTDRATYSSEAQIANPTASNDLRRLVDAGLLRITGGGRSTAYEPTRQLTDSVAQESA